MAMMVRVGRGLVNLPTSAAIETSFLMGERLMSRNKRLAEGDWEQFWEEQPMEDWEERLLVHPEFDEEFEEDWEELDGHIYRCPRCGTNRLVDAEDLSLAEASGVCEECMWETQGGREESDEISYD